MSSDNAAIAEINAAFEDMASTIRRETIWLPVIVSAAWGGSLGLVLWNAFTGDDASGWGISHAIILVFAIFQTWTFWDLDARRRVENLKYQTAAGLLDRLADEHGWTWGESDEPGSVSLNSPHRKDPDDEVTLTADTGK